MKGVCFQSLHGNGMLLMLLVQGLVLFILRSSAKSDHHLRPPPQALAGCSDHCGNLTIPYPFGIGEGCHRGPGFFINCSTNTTNKKQKGSPIPYLTMGSGTDRIKLQVTNISLEDGEVHVLQPITRNCGKDLTSSTILLLPSSFTISETRNSLFSVGCGSSAIFIGNRSNQALTIPGTYRFCSTYCIDSIYNNNSNDTLIPDDGCSGFGCDQNSLPSGVQNLFVTLSSVEILLNKTNQDRYSKYYPCKYAFVVDKSRFSFSPNTTLDQLNKTSHLPVVVNWRIGDAGSCNAAQKAKNSSFACKKNSACVDLDNARGYICQCNKGYQGNPYHPDGCQDVDECKLPNLCRGRCVNTPGDFYCGDESRTMLVVFLALGGILLVGIIWSLYWAMKQRKYIKLKDKYFQENGGLLLQHKLASSHGIETTRIFTAEELEKATNNYNDSRVLGKGAYGVVYKGILPDNKMVAIKKSRVAAPMQSEQLVNELVVLSQINHRNVVRILGCCLESEVPSLVYEFITNGTLFEHIHGERNEGTSLGWESRLKIAAEIAEALAYLHYSTILQIIHRDVKAMNILLDDNYTAKVADFGASVLIPLDHAEITTFVQGTLGYLDPEYLQSNQLTEKSDVYSFGVVLAELLTREVAFSYERPEAKRSLARLFVSAIEEERLTHILDDGIVNEANMETIRNVARLAYRCLRLKGEERPSMREVATELEKMRIMANHPLNNYDLRPEDQSSLLLRDYGFLGLSTTGTSSRSI